VTETKWPSSAQTIFSNTLLFNENVLILSEMSPLKVVYYG